MDENVEYAKLDVCLASRLSGREETISMVENLQTQIEPNHSVSRIVSNAISKHKEQVDRLIEIVENEFKSINDDVERQILNACRGLVESLNAIDNSLPGILEDRNSDDFVKIDFIQKCYGEMDVLIDGRNRKINDFMDALRGLEKKRTSMIESCYERHMLAVKRLSCDSFQRLYEKYLKNYNAIKIGNFRTYEDVRFKLVQMNDGLQKDFVLKTYDVKLKIKNNIANSFLDKLKTTAKTIMSDRIDDSRTKSIKLLCDLNDLFDEMAEKSNEQTLNMAFVVQCTDSLKSYSNNLDEIMESVALLGSEINDEIQTVLTKTNEEFNQIFVDSGENLSSDESVAIYNEMSTRVDAVRREKVNNIVDLQLFLSDIKEAVRAIYRVFSPAIEIFHGHSKRLTMAKNVFLIALDGEIKRNNTKLNELENYFNDALDAIVRASNETEVLKLEKKCEDILERINDRIQVNQYSEIEILSDYKDLRTSESQVTKLEVKIVLDLYLDNLKPLPEFDVATRNEPWPESIDKLIVYFKTTMKNCQDSVFKCLSTLILELKSENISNEACAWSNLLNHSIDQRFDMAVQLLEFRKSRVHDGIVSKRLDEIKQHRNLLDCHITVVLEIGDRLKNETKELYERFHKEEKKVLIEIDSLTLSEINEMPSAELINVINGQKERIRLVATDFNRSLKSHGQNVDAGYGEIIRLTLEYIKSIKMFTEGGNYGHKEAMVVVNTLNRLSNTMLDERIKNLESLRPTGYGSLVEIKEVLSKPMKPWETQLDRKLFRQKCHAINKLMSVTINQEILNLNRTADSLKAKLRAVREALEKGVVKESSKHWSELLTKTRDFIDFLLESYQDIRALLKPDIKNTIWNTKSEKSYVSSKMAANSKHTFYREKLRFYDYCKTIVIDYSKGTDGSARFLNNIYQTIFHYVSESQINAADMASTEVMANYWIGTEDQDVMQIYRQIMGEVLTRSKAIVLRAELIWIFKLSEFSNLLDALYETESDFKNVVLATYHEESVAKFNEAFGASEHEMAAVRKQSKTVREQLNYQLKPSHGHAQNVGALDALLGDFHVVRRQCSESLSDVCARIGASLEKYAENYEAQCPRSVLNATTLFIKCHSSLRTQLDHINVKSSAIVLELSVISEALVEKVDSLSDNSVEVAVKNLKQHWRLLPGTVFWPSNKRLWADNVQIFLQLYRDRMGDVQTFSAVEKSKLVDWASVFVRDVEQVKKLHE